MPSDTLSTAGRAPELGDTLASRGPISGETQIPLDARHTTVLPKVEWHGDLPRLVNPQRARFEELGVLGVGGMGEVVLVKDNDINRTVALKRLPLGMDMGAVLRFVNEVRTVGSLEHPNIVPVHDVGVDPTGRLYFVMKRVEGETLQNVITRLREGDKATLAKYSFQMRTQVFTGVLAAVAYAHKQGFVHRDLKPANIMLGPYGEVTVVDWGLAKRIHGPDGAALIPEKANSIDPSLPATLDTQLGSVMGTPLYMSPEQARGEHDKVDERSDVYSLTVLLHELLFHTHYLAGLNTIGEVLEAVKSFAPVLPFKGVPSELVWFLRRGFAKNPAERFQSVEEMRQHMFMVINGQFKVQCASTLTKRLLNALAGVLDRKPAAFLALGSLALALIAVALGRLAIDLVRLL